MRDWLKLIEEVMEAEPPKYVVGKYVVFVGFSKTIAVLFSESDEGSFGQGRPHLYRMSGPPSVAIAALELDGEIHNLTEDRLNNLIILK